jgi:hypothetical protein
MGVTTSMTGNSDKNDIAQQHHIDLERGGGSEPSDSTWELASDLGSSSPPPPCAVDVSPLAPVALFKF